MATINDVARRAGVSSTTVSVVLNKKEQLIRISEGTREKVWEAVKELDYTPNRWARALRTNRSSIVAVLAFDVVDPYCAHIIRGADRVFRSTEYSPMIFDLNNDRDRLRSSIGLLEKRNVDGVLIIASSVEVDEKIVQELQARHVPFVLIGRETPHSSVPTVVVDNRRGAFMAVQHLVDLGHRKIAFILGPEEYVDSAQRWEGASAAMQQNGLAVPDKWVVREKEVGWSPHAGYSSMRTLLRGGADFTAVVAFDDISGFGAVRALLDHGMRVPEDVSVLGFDDIPASAYFNPPLTTIGYSMVAMGEAGAEMLVRSIDHADQPNTRRLVVPTSLIARRSTERIHP